MEPDAPPRRRKVTLNWFHHHLGDDNNQPSLSDGIARARKILSEGHSPPSKSDHIETEENAKQQPEVKRAKS